MSTDAGLVFIGWVARSHGVRGELKLLEGEGASGAWQDADELYIGKEQESAVRFRVKRLRAGTRFVILALEGVKDRNRADELKGQLVFVSRQQLPEPEEDTYYLGDLVGLQVVDREGRRIGVLKQIFDNGAHDVYVVENGSAEILIPGVEGVVIEVARERNEIVVDPPEGLPGF